MEANELRIGNLVLDEDGDILPIRIITKSRVFHGDNPLSCTFSDIETIRGIDLTDEWLRRLGFSIDKDSMAMSGAYLYEKGILAVWDNDGDWDIVIGEKERYISLLLDLNYVHQLQNLNFAMFGEELSITNVEATKINQ